MREARDLYPGLAKVASRDCEGILEKLMSPLSMHRKVGQLKGHR